MSDWVRSYKHRLYPPPDRPWIATQAWHDVLFAHWRIPIETMRRCVPDSLQVDTYDGYAWVGVVPFMILGTRPRWIPPIPRLSDMPEVNLRTYVTVDNKPGVFFFSLDINNPIAVIGARWLYRVAYYHSQIQMQRANGQVVQHSHRQHPGAESAEFHASYHPVGAVRHAEKGSLEYFLTERYCLYAVGSRGGVYRTHVHHKPWDLQTAQAAITVNTLASVIGLPLPDEEPLLHYSSGVDALIWLPEKV
jgi:uncharacterized protein